LNRANGRLQLFSRPFDYAAFETTLLEAWTRLPLRIIGYSVMPNHWHFVVWPRVGAHDEVSEFFRWLTVTHTQRWHACHGTSGSGHLYQGRFKAFPVQGDEHLHSVLRYVERNPVRARLVERAEMWRWGSLWRRMFGTEEHKHILTNSPAPLGSEWLSHVNAPQSDAELEALRGSLRKGRPYGRDEWAKRAAKNLHLQHTFRSPGRPSKKGTGVICEQEL
jgi:putative transposase